MLKLFNDNLSHAGDKLIKGKCVALINKGPQLQAPTQQTSSTVPVDPQSVVPSSTEKVDQGEEETPADEDAEEETPEADDQAQDK